MFKKETTSQPKLAQGCHDNTAAVLLTSTGKNAPPFNWNRSVGNKQLNSELGTDDGGSMTSQ